jgi:signal transduction histidine kinase
MKTRSLFVMGLILFLGFGSILAMLLYSDMRLQDFHNTQAKAIDLLLTWKKSETLTMELFITYNLSQTRQEWLKAKTKFETDLQSFLEAPATLNIIKRDPDFKLKVDILKISWDAKRNKLADAEKQLDIYLEEVDRENKNSGNLLVTFGENLATGTKSANLVELLAQLKWSTSLSNYLFSLVLTNLSQKVTTTIEEQTQRLRLKVFMLSLLILGAAGLFIYSRMAEMARSREAAKQNAMMLSMEIEERQRAEKMMCSEHDKLNTVLNTMGEGVYIVNRDFIIEYQNDILNKRYGEIIGKVCYEMYTETNRPCMSCCSHKAIESGKIHQGEAILHKGKSYEPIFSPFADMDGQVKAIVVVRDVTERKRFEAENARAAQLASIGELAAGVAHEINNPIYGIISIAEMLKDQFQRKGEDVKIPGMIIMEGERIAKIVKNLLLFAQDRKDEKVLANIFDILQDTMGLIEKQIVKDGIKLRVIVPLNLPEIRARSQELQQVFLNILSNARYALNQKFPGPHDKKYIEIDGKEIDNQEGRWVRITFHDQGVGIPAEIIDKICNPFFTSKPKGQGTGLGLSISHGIIENHQGRLKFYSVPGEYTRVVIDFPANDG